MKHSIGGTKAFVSQLCCDAYYLLLIDKEDIGKDKYRLFIVTEFLSRGIYEAVYLFHSE